MARGSTRSGDRNQTGGDRYIPDRGYGLWRRGDRYTTDRWLGLTGSTPPAPGGGGLADGEKVTIWKDSSLQGNDATSIGNPVFKTYMVGGQPVVRLTSASSDGFNLKLPIDSTTAWSCFMVMKPATPTSVLFSLSSKGGGVNDSITSGYFGGDGNLYMIVHGGYWWFILPDKNAFHVISINNYAAPDVGFNFRFDGVTPLSIGQQPNPVYTGSFDCIGYRAAGSLFSNGDIAEIIYLFGNYNDTVNVATRQNIEKTLSVKYGTPAPPAGSVMDLSTLPAQGWWKADSLWTAAPALVDGDPVSIWPDSSNAGHRARQLTVSKQPILKKNVLNGKPVVRFTVAGQSGLLLDTGIPNALNTPISFFFVAKRNTAADGIFVLMCSNPGLWGCGIDPGGVPVGASPWYYMQSIQIDPGGAFHIWSMLGISSVSANMFTDGTLYANSAGAQGPSMMDQIGFLGASLSNGDIAEIIVYQGALALRLKLSLLLTVLLSTAEFPGTEEFDAMVGDRNKIKRYLHRHGVTATESQLRDVVTPMTVGDRANIEKYLSVKYGIAVTSGGTAADPSTIPGLLAWYKADSL